MWNKRMIRRIKRRLERYNFSQLEDFHRLSLRKQRVNMALARAAVTSSLRHLDSTDPLSWSFSGFSQHAEDGIIDYLTRKITRPNYYFVEIGAADGLENNTSWLAIAKRYSGLMVEGNREYSAVCQHIISDPGGLNVSVESVCMFVTRENAHDLKQRAIHPNPDVFSIDIDGNDYYVAEALMEAGVRPKICAVEYNSAFGPNKSLTIKYQNDHIINFEDHVGSLYYGVSITGWTNFFARYGYKFVTVEESGTNAFFIDPREFDYEFVNGLSGLAFQENAWQTMRLKVGWEQQFKLIEMRDLVEIKGSLIFHSL